MSHLATKLWDSMETLFTSEEHEELLAEILEDEGGEKVTFFLREALGENHEDSDYYEALKQIEMLARYVTDDVETELISYRELLNDYPVLGHFLKEDDVRELVESFNERVTARANKADYYVGLFLLVKAEERQRPEFKVHEYLS